MTWFLLSTLAAGQGCFPREPRPLRRDSECNDSIIDIMSSTRW